MHLLQHVVQDKFLLEQIILFAVNCDGTAFN
jgi:hypothetical protein